MEEILGLQAKLVLESNYKNVNLVEENGESFLTMDYDATESFYETIKELQKFEEFENMVPDEILEKAVISILTESMKVIDDEDN